MIPVKLRTRISSDKTSKFRKMTMEVAQVMGDIAAFTALVSRIFGAISKATSEYERNG